MSLRFGFSLVVTAAACLALAGAGFGQAANSAPAQSPATKTFIDYFKPTPITSSLSSSVWGAAAVGPRDPKNGLEDETMTKWDYWDGKIIKGPDGKYHHVRQPLGSGQRPRRLARLAGRARGQRQTHRALH